MAPAVPWFPSRERLRNRELGGCGCRPVAFTEEISRRRCDAATLSGDKTFVHRWAGGINCLELDETERRYLLVGTVDAVIAVYDTEQPTVQVQDSTTGAARHGEERGEWEWERARHAALFVVYETFSPQLPSRMKYTKKKNKARRREMGRGGANIPSRKTRSSAPPLLRTFIHSLSHRSCHLPGDPGNGTALPHLQRRRRRRRGRQ